MIKLSLIRAYPKEKYTVGLLYVDRKYFSATMEDPDRGLLQSMSPEEIRKIKIPGKTAIPRGTYRLSLTVSAKFKNRTWAKSYGGLVPLVEDVPGYSGIRIHPGNTADDSAGCILPGHNLQPGKVLNSVATYRRLMDEVLYPAHLRGEEMSITIKL